MLPMPSSFNFHRRRSVAPAALVALAVLAALGSGCSEPSLAGVCEPGTFRCQINVYEVCSDGGDRWVPVEDCAPEGKTCALGPGCVTCFPEARSCEGFDIVRCRPDGTAEDPIATCDGEIGDVCFDGRCINACELAAQSRSYDGCEYWAVDLDNAVVATQGAAAAQQFSVVLSNASPLVAQVTIEILCTAADAANPAIGCAEGQVHVIEGPLTVPPGDLEIVDLDPRELDGSSAPQLNDGTGTHLSPHAFRIRSTAPLVAYQFNPLENVNVFSNDASLLLPTPSLGSQYMVLSWPQTLAVTNEAETNGGIDLRAFLTIVGTADDTQVRVKLSTDIVGGAAIPAAKKGDEIIISINAFEVINLETGGFLADFTSTEVRSDADKPVAVFTGSEASDVPRFFTFLDRRCCADHLEEQLFPESALGRQFVIVKTPLRSPVVDASGWDVAVVPDEPEYFRVVATREDTSVTTDLPPPNNSWLLQRGSSVIIESERDFILQASGPVAVGQFPGGQQTTGIPSTLPGGVRPPGGDPSFIMVPPTEQWRSDYLFLVPNKYAFDYLLIAAPSTAQLIYDGLPLDMVLACEYEPMGRLPATGGGETEYVAIRCQLSYPSPAGPGLQDDGVHRLETSNAEPFGLTVYGWDSFVSYGYPGGTNVALINLE